MKIVLLNDNTDKGKINELQNLLIEFKNYPNSIETGVVYNELGLIFLKNKNNIKASIFFKKSINILKYHKKNNLFELNRSRNNLAWIYMLEGEINKQYFLLNQIIKDNGKDKNTFNAINNTAIIDSERGDYYLGLKKLNLLLAGKNSIENELIIRINIIKIYALMTETDFTIKINSHKSIIKNHHNFIENNFDNSDLNEKLRYEFYNNLANVYESLEDYDTALELYLKSKKYFKEQSNPVETFFILNNIGYLYAKQKKTDLSSKYFEEIINNSTDINQIATAYDNLGYFSNIKSTEKISYFQKAIQIILEKKEVNFTLPSLELIRESGCQQDVLVYLIDLAYNYVESFKETHNKLFLFKAKDTLYLIDELVSLIRYESNTEQSKLFWIGKGVNTYLLATEVCYLLNKPDEGFYFIEKNKALLLQENIKTFQAKLELEIPKKVQQEEYKLHYELLLAEKKYQQHPNNASCKESYNIKNKEFEKLMTSLSHKYPDYTRIKQKIEIVSLKKIFSTLKNDECFVTYILNKDNGYGLFSNSKENIFFRIDNVVSFQKNVKEFKKYMTQHLLDKKSVKTFQLLSNKVFNSLFPFKNADNKIINKKLIIIADDSLLGFPFEALTVNSKKRLSESYLINYSEISYLQSFSVFEKIKQSKNKTPKKLLVIAPYKFEDKYLSELIRSKEAINALKKYRSGDILFDKEATKENFYSENRNYEILHLNTHAGVDKLTQLPWIAFRNKKLTLNELYGINNRAELVILDACKTNAGQIESGEGIISLSRGFFMNGSKSVLASLWNVNEKTGNEIITSFYSELEKGRTKSRALQLAKTNYLKQHQYSEILPYYWASFTLTGSRTPIELSEKWYYKKQPLIIISLVILFAIGLIIKLK